MGKNSSIQWTDHTWNWNYGCSKVSTGCKNCYMFTWAKRSGRDPEKVTKAAPATFNKPLIWANEGRAKVFSCSLGDFFHEGADAWRDEAYNIMLRTPALTYQVLTKRPERILAHLPGVGAMPVASLFGRPMPSWPWPNIWFGTSVENQAMAEKRIPELLNVPAVVHWLSCEPLLGPLDLSPWLHGFTRIEWVVIGGESDQLGEKGRPFDINWARSIIKQCREAGVAVFVKQLGSQPYKSPDRDGGTGYEMKLKDHHGGDWGEWPEDLRIREFPKVRL